MAELFSGVDLDEVGSQIQWELESLSIEDLWARSGKTARGYSEPGDASSEPIEEALEPFKEQLNTYSRLALEPEAKLYFMGLLKGIYDFANDSNTEFKDWAVDVPDASFTVILDDWRNRTTDRNALAEMDAFLHKHCPAWT